ncbi:MAG TPA: SAM-dependent methyltransferase, partial [Clostridiales bacterium]|nr:SAM-dependent methyltransferase [Clostridiales bacterium]
KRHPLWNKADAVYNRSSSGGGQWNDHTLPESWLIHYGDMTLKIKPM